MLYVYFNKTTTAKVSDFGIIFGVCWWGVCIPLPRAQRDDLEKTLQNTVHMPHHSLFLHEALLQTIECFCSMLKGLSGLLLNNELKEMSP